MKIIVHIYICNSKQALVIIAIVDMFIKVKKYTSHEEICSISIIFLNPRTPMYVLIREIPCVWPFPV